MKHSKIQPLAPYFFAVITLLVAPLHAQTTRPVPAIERAIIFSIDGLRPDLALRANTPTIHKLMTDGCFTFWAKTTAVSVTLPSHTSMLTGVTPQKHGVEWNRDLPFTHPVYPLVPTLFEFAKRSGYTTAMTAGKSKFVALAKPGSLDWQWIPQAGKVEDPDVAAQAVQIIHEHQPQVMFVHFPGVDNVGHAVGWASPEQIAAIEQADACVGQVLAAIDSAGVREHTFVIVTADHGGAGLSHGPDDDRSRHIPWLASGPGIRKGFDLTRVGTVDVHTEDTFATTCYLLGIPRGTYLDGKPVREILEDAQLLESSGK